MGYRVAVVGATGNVGREMLQTLAERDFPVDEIVALASEKFGRAARFRSARTTRSRCAISRSSTSRAPTSCCSSPGAKVSAVHSPRAAKAGAVVIDNTSHFRMDPDVPLIVPEVNADAIKGLRKRNIVANPNCSTIQMVVALKPLHDLARSSASWWRPISPSRVRARRRWTSFSSRRAASSWATRRERKKFTKQIAFNVIPHIDVFMEDGSTKEEWKMVAETKKILDANIEVTATCVRVPVFIGHAEAVNVEFERPITVGEAREALRAAPGVSVVDHRVDEGYVTPVGSAGRRRGLCQPNSPGPDDQARALNLWIVSDNLRKGAALNAVQIAEELIRSYMAKAA